MMCILILNTFGTFYQGFDSRGISESYAMLNKPATEEVFHWLLFSKLSYCVIFLIYLYTKVVVCGFIKFLTKWLALRKDIFI